jgi:cytochrome c-type biogenesis protein CcmH
MFLVYAGLFLIPVVAILILPFWLKKHHPVMTGINASENEDLSSLVIEKETLLGTLADLEVDRDQGKYSPEDYLRSKQANEHRLLIILRQLEETREKVALTDTPQNVPPSTGMKTGPRFILSFVIGVLIVAGTAEIRTLVYGKIQRSQQAAGEEGRSEVGEAVPPVNPVEMVARLEKKLKENPNDLQGQMMAGRSYATLQRWDDAKNAWKKAVELDGRNEVAQFNYADVLLRTAKPGDRAVYQEALDHLNIALMKVPREPVILWTKGVALLNLGKNMETDQVWTEAYQYLPPGSKDADFVKQALQNLRSGKFPAN